MIKIRRKKFVGDDDKKKEKKVKYTLDYNGETIDIYNIDQNFKNRQVKQNIINFIGYISQTSKEDTSYTYDGVGFFKKLDEAYGAVKSSTDPETKRLTDFAGIISKKSGYEPDRIRNLINFVYRSLNKVKNDITNIEGRELIFSNDEYIIEKLGTPQAVIAFSDGDCWCCICGVSISDGTPLSNQVESARQAMSYDSNCGVGYDNNNQVIRGNFYGFKNKLTGKKYFLVYREGYPYNYKVWTQRDNMIFQRNGENSKVTMSNKYAPQAEEFLRGLRNVDHLGDININFKELYDISTDKAKKEQLMQSAQLTGYGTGRELEVALSPEERAQIEREETLRKIQLIENEFEDEVKFSAVSDWVSIRFLFKGSYRHKVELNRTFRYDDNNGNTQGFFLFEENLIKINNGNSSLFMNFLNKVSELMKSEPMKIQDPDDESVIHTEVPFECKEITFVFHFGEMLKYIDLSTIPDKELASIKRRDEYGILNGSKIEDGIKVLQRNEKLLSLNNAYGRFAVELTSIGTQQKANIRMMDYLDENKSEEIAEKVNKFIEERIKSAFAKGQERDTNFARTIYRINNSFGGVFGFKLPRIYEENIKYDELIRDKGVNRTRYAFIDSECFKTYARKKENGEKLVGEDIVRIAEEALQKFPDGMSRDALITPEELEENLTNIHNAEIEVDERAFSGDNEELANSNTYIKVENARKEDFATSIEWIDSKTNYIDLRALINLLIKNNINTCEEALNFFNETGVDNIKVGKKDTPLNNNVKEMLKASLDALNQKFSDTEQEEIEEPEIIEEEQESNEENNETITREEILEETQGRGFEFDNGDYYGIDFDEENQILFAGSISNSGVSRDVEIEYDNDKSIGGNLEALYSKCIEENPDLLNEVEVDEEQTIEENEETPTQEEVSNAPTKETHDGGLLQLDENGNIEIVYSANEEEAETTYTIINLATYANIDDLTITETMKIDMIDELLRQADLDENEAEEYINNVLFYLGINIIPDNDEEETSDGEEE